MYLSTYVRGIVQSMGWVSWEGERVRLVREWMIGKRVKTEVVALRNGWWQCFIYICIAPPPLGLSFGVLYVRSI
jgi:hypothetical protein